MTFEAWLTAIGLPSAAQAVAIQPVPDLEQWHQLVADEPAFLTRLAGQPALALQVFAQLLYGEQAHYPTLAEWVADGRDIAIWAADYAQKQGGIGVTENDWLRFTLVHQVVRLGRLQFEPWQPTTALGPLAAGTQTLQVHIPADGPLLPVACDEAFALAQARFGQLPLVCDSWLMSPALQALLPATSNIRQFQERFQVAAVDPTAHQAEERLFGAWQADPAQYVTHTALQKRAKAWLQAGKQIGMAIGVALPEA